MARISLVWENGCNPFVDEFDSRAGLGGGTEMILAAQTAPLDTFDYVAATVLFCLGCVGLLICFLSEGFRKKLGLGIPGGSITFVLGCLTLLGLCVFLLR